MEIRKGFEFFKDKTWNFIYLLFKDYDNLIHFGWEIKERVKKPISWFHLSIVYSLEF